MQDRLVTTCIKILRGLPPTGLSVNKIIAQTSRDRSHVIEAVNELVTGKLVAHGQWSIGKPKVMKLTNVGTEIKDLLESLNAYTDAYKKLKNANAQMKITNRNLNDGISFVDDICQKDILFALTYRYATIYYNNELNQISREILVKIVSDAMMHYLSHHLEEPKDKRREKIIRRFPVRTKFKTLFSSIRFDINCLYTKDFQISSSPFLNERIKEVMTAILRITKPSQFDLTDSINFVEEYNTNETDWEKYGQDYGEYMYDRMKQKEYVQYGPYDETPNSKEIREKDREELINIYKNLLPDSLT